MDEETIEPLVALVAVVTLPVGILAGLFAGWEVSAAVFVVGWLLLVPVLAIAGDALGDDGADDRHAEAAPLEEAKRAYARGEIDEAELERRTGVILETDRQAGENREGDRDREREFEL